jgi:hypothetical protein
LCKEHKINKDTSLGIGGWYIPKIVCKRLIDYYEDSVDEVVVGRVGGGTVDLSKKDSRELYITKGHALMSNELKGFLDELYKVLELFKKLYPAANETTPWGLSPIFKIQKYAPGKAYTAWHYERAGELDVIKRHLTFTTYLSTIQEGGETEFFHQNLKVKPEEGLTIIFSADWIHKHRGLPATKDTKYIVTGWFEYIIN